MSSLERKRQARVGKECTCTPPTKNQLELKQMVMGDVGTAKIPRQLMEEESRHIVNNLHVDDNTPPSVALWMCKLEHHGGRGCTLPAHAKARADQVWREGHDPTMMQCDTLRFMGAATKGDTAAFDKMTVIARQMQLTDTLKLGQAVQLALFDTAKLENKIEAIEAKKNRGIMFDCRKLISLRKAHKKARENLGKCVAMTPKTHAKLTMGPQGVGAAAGSATQPVDLAGSDGSGDDGSGAPPPAPSVAAPAPAPSATAPAPAPSTTAPAPAPSVSNPGPAPSTGATAPPAAGTGTTTPTATSTSTNTGFTFAGTASSMANNTGFAFPPAAVPPAAGAGFAVPPTPSPTATHTGFAFGATAGTPSASAGFNFPGFAQATAATPPFQTTMPANVTGNSGGNPPPFQGTTQAQGPRRSIFNTMDDGKPFAKQAKVPPHQDVWWRHEPLWVRHL